MAPSRNYELIGPAGRQVFPEHEARRLLTAKPDKYMAAPDQEPLALPNETAGEAPVPTPEPAPALAISPPPPPLPPIEPAPPIEVDEEAGE